MKRTALAALAVTSVTACSRDSTAPTDPGFAINVAPLSFPGVVDACYTLTVYNTNVAGVGPGAIVWQETSICADRYGDGEGSITYIGTCDADPSGRTNTVSLVLEGLCQSTGCDPSDDDDPGTIDSTTYVNPCPTGKACLRERPCVGNGDTRVDFNLTIMRRANQGFFDVAVTFRDVFCSAKLDCVPELLHRPEGGPRDLTAVLAFACTSGADETCLYATNVTLDCGGSNVWQIDPSAGPGNIDESSPLLYGAATYQGDEAFTAFQKSYWTIALGLDTTMFATYPDCTLRWTTTASEAELEGAGPYVTPDGTAYPLLVWERDILVGGLLSCESHGLDQILPGEELASVATDYSPPDAPASFPFTSCAPDEPNACACPAGFSPNEDGTICRRVRTASLQTSEVVLDVCNGGTDGSYSTHGARFTTSWSPGAFEIPESGDPNATCTDAAVCVSEATGWSGYLNGIGVWACQTSASIHDEPVTTWIGFSECLTLPAAGDYLIGIAGDNAVRLSVDGDTIYESTSSVNFRAWNVGRVAFAAGTHLIELAGLNLHGVAAFGAEIYGPFTPGTVSTPAQMAAALNPPIDPGLIVFSTRDLRPVNGTSVAQFQTSSDGSSGFTCDDGFALDLCGAEPGCTDIDEVACGTTGDGGTTTACDEPGPAVFTDTFTRADGPLGSSYLDTSGVGLPLAAPAIVSQAACSSAMAYAITQARTPASGGALHVEYNVTFGHDQQRQAMVIALDTCPTTGAAVITAGLDGGSNPPRLTIAAPLANQRVQAPLGVMLQPGVTYRLAADFWPDGTVIVVVTQGNSVLSQLVANVVGDGLLPAVPAYHQAGFVVGREGSLPASCVDNLSIETF